RSVLRDGPGLVAARKGVGPLEERHHHLGQRGGARLLAALTQAIELRLRGTPVAGGGERHAYVEIVEEEQRHLEPAAGSGAQVLPALRIGLAVEIETPGQGDRVLEIRAYRDGDVAKYASEELVHLLVATLGQVHEGEMPQEVILEVPEVIAGIDAKRQRLDAAQIFAALVEHVGEGVHGPRIAGI